MIGQAFNCSACGTAEGGAVETPVGKYAGAFRTEFLVGEERGLFFIWYGGLMAAYSVDGIAQESAVGMAGGGYGSPQVEC